jgi:RND family efflux transporter MFP subunit
MKNNKSGWRKKPLSWITALATMATFVMLPGCNSSNADVPEGASASPRPVKVMTVTGSDSMEYRSFPGIVKADREIDLAFRVGGPLIEYDLKIGATVKKGEIIARIDPRDFEVRVRKLSAELKAAEARLTDAEKDYERQKNLLDENAASQSQYDKTQMLVDTTRAGIESLKADLAAARNALADTRLAAPFDGVVNRKLTENHETVSPGMPVVSLLDVSSLEVATAVPEDIIIRGTDFKQISVVLDAHTGVTIDATLKEIGRQISNTNQSYPLTVVLNVPAGLSVEPGMAATVKMRIPSETAGNEGLSLPTAAVFADADGQSCVWRLTDEMKTKKVFVETGNLKGDAVLITSGLSIGDQVVSAGARFLVEGQTVRVLESSGGAS